MDDSTDLRLPWSLAPRSGKYYGTRVLDSHGEEVINFWDHGVPSHPSPREKEWFGNWTEERWAEGISDSHWESDRDYRRAVAVVKAINATAGEIAP